MTPFSHATPAQRAALDRLTRADAIMDNDDNDDNAAAPSRVQATRCNAEPRHPNDRDGGSR